MDGSHVQVYLRYVRSWSFFSLAYNLRACLNVEPHAEYRKIFRAKFKLYNNLKINKLKRDFPVQFHKHFMLQPYEGDFSLSIQPCSNNNKNKLHIAR